MNKQLEVTPELIQDLETIAGLMKKHDINFAVDGYCHDPEAGLLIEGHWVRTGSWPEMEWYELHYAAQELKSKLEP